jgi:hypothetical protein
MAKYIYNSIGAYQKSNFHIRKACGNAMANFELVLSESLFVSSSKIKERPYRAVAV